MKNLFCFEGTLACFIIRQRNSAKKLMDQLGIPINSSIMLNASRIRPEKYLATYVRTAKPALAVVLRT